jgi:hypothetical protein
VTSKPNLKAGPRKDRNGRELVPSMHTFALRHPWYWERLRWLKKWTVENWTKAYVRAEGPPGTKGEFRPEDAPTASVFDDLLRQDLPVPMALEHDHRTTVNGLALAEAVSSEDVKTGLHHILIDIDRRAVLLPSTSVGHFHLYVEMGMCGDGMKWEDYAEWLRASAKIGLIEEGYAEASIRRKATFLRLPWIRKGHELADRERALGWWIDQPEEVGPGGKPPEQVPF